MSTDDILKSLTKTALRGEFYVFRCRYLAIPVEPAI